VDPFASGPERGIANSWTIPAPLFRDRAFLCQCPNLRGPISYLSRRLSRSRPTYVRPRTRSSLRILGHRKFRPRIRRFLTLSPEA
jgi:hypothetical protein